MKILFFTVAVLCAVLTVTALPHRAQAARSDHYDTVQKVYIGYYQRPADPGGLLYWAERLEGTNGNLNDIIEAYANSVESRALYGTINNSSISNVVDSIYVALFNRHVEAGGLNYYVDGFVAGRFTAATIMLNILDGARNQDLLSVNNKVTAANLFTRIIDPELDGNDFQYNYSGDADAQRARGFLSAVTSDPATIPAEDGTRAFLVASPGHFLMTNVGLYISQFERRGSWSQYWPGEVIRNWNDFDSIVGSTVAQEVSLQLDKIKELGVNTIVFEIRASDPTSVNSFVPPECNIGPALGLQFPQPTAVELANLPLFFDLVNSKGIKVWLRLVNTHMEEQPPTGSETWLGAIFEVIGSHPALDLIIFEGSPHMIDTNGDGVTDSCGIPAEPPLYAGPGSIPATYVQWAVAYGMSRGMPARKLSSEAIVGDYFIESQGPAGPDFVDQHQWSPIAVLKGIFDNLGIPADERTYAISFYEHRKCSITRGLPCTDLNPHDWAEETIQHVSSIVGKGNGARIVAPEMGNSVPVGSQWSTPHALESLAFLLHKYRIDGGTFWRWVNNMAAEDADATIATPVKQRGTSFTYNAVVEEVIDMAGFHVPVVPNGSFESGVGATGVPLSWSVDGSGVSSRYLLTQEAGQPEVPSRGIYAMRMITGSGLTDTVTATSNGIPAVASKLFTTTANLRFVWTGDPRPSAPRPSRPQVFIKVLHYQSDWTPSAIRTQDTFSYFEEDSTSGFATFPVQYITPADGAYVKIQFGASRNGLPSAITLDVDNVR